MEDVVKAVQEDRVPGDVSFDIWHFLDDEMKYWEMTPVSSGKDGSTAKEQLAAAWEEGRWMLPGQKFLSSRPSEALTDYLAELRRLRTASRPPLEQMNGKKETALQLAFNNIFRNEDM